MFLAVCMPLAGCEGRAVPGTALVPPAVIDASTPHHRGGGAESLVLMTVPRREAAVARSGDHHGQVTVDRRGSRRWIWITFSGVILLSLALLLS